ncbi:MAG: hypothetical protein HC780_04550 [Leptolyngbyaceae cyanobacterium CSU_1_3]|nr:hypothetical protein [Leptolyngbyaceae cyanobacterium CSU_1_3]
MMSNIKDEDKSRKQLIEELKKLRVQAAYRRQKGACKDAQSAQTIQSKTAFSLLEAALEEASNGILVVDLERAIVHCNHKFAQQWAYLSQLLFAEPRSITRLHSKSYKR